jgi:hypothetical protein
MSKWLGQLSATTVFALWAVGSWSGCGTAGSSLPQAVTLTLPDGTQVEVNEGGGAPSLANSKWQFYRVAANGQSAAFATIVFGPTGNLQKFEKNKLAENLFGDEVVFDSTRRATKQAGLTYSAATYGAETSDATGFTFEGRFTAYFSGLAAGQAEASASASYNEEDPNTVNGVFHFVTRTTLPIEIPGANQEDTFPFVGQRLE